LPNSQTTSLSVEGVLTRALGLCVHGIGIGSAHLLVLHPDPSIVALLSSETGQGSKDNSGNHHTGNGTRRNDACLLRLGQIGSGTLDGPRRNLRDNTLLNRIIASCFPTIVAFLTLRVLKVGLGVDPMARVRAFLAEHTNTSAVETSYGVIASRGRTIVCIVSDLALDGRVDAADRRTAGCRRTDRSLAHNRSVDTAGSAVGGVVVAGVHCAIVVIIASIEDMRARASGGVARVNGAQNAVVAVDRGDIAAICG